MVFESEAGLTGVKGKVEILGGVWLIGGSGLVLDEVGYGGTVYTALVMALRVPSHIAIEVEEDVVLP